MCALVQLTACFGVPRRKTPTWSRSARETPKLGGRDAAQQGAGGMFRLLHNMQRSSPTQSSLPKSKRHRETPTSSRSASLPPISSVAPKWGAANAPSSHRYGANPDLLLGASRWQAPFAGGRPSAKREKVRSARRREPHRMIRLRWRVQGLPVYVRCVQNQRKELSNATRIFEYKVPCQGWSKAARQERPLTQP